MEPIVWDRINKIEKMINLLSELDELIDYLQFKYDHQECSVSECFELTKAYGKQRRLIQKLRKHCAKFLEESNGI